jgi:hypothetical protein
MTIMTTKSFRLHQWEFSSLHHPISNATEIEEYVPFNAERRQTHAR